MYVVYRHGLFFSCNMTNTFASTACSNHLRIQKSFATHIMLSFSLVILMETKIKLDTNICSHYSPKDTISYTAPKVILPSSNSTCLYSVFYPLISKCDLHLTQPWQFSEGTYSLGEFHKCHFLHISHSISSPIALSRKESQSSMPQKSLQLMTPACKSETTNYRVCQQKGHVSVDNFLFISCSSYIAAILPQL